MLRTKIIAASGASALITSYSMLWTNHLEGAEASTVPAVELAMESNSHWSKTIASAATTAATMPLPPRLDAVNYADVSADVELWEKVLQKIRVGDMPPPDEEQPLSEE